MKTTIAKSMIKKDSIPKHVLNDLRKQIILGSYKATDRLREIELSEQYNTSRGTIRSALQDLSSEGLVEFLDSGGCVVSDIGEKFISDTYDFRGLLEEKAASIILDSPDISYLPMISALDKFNEIDSSKATIETYVDLDINFHQAIVQTSNNKPIYRAWCQMSPVINVLLTLNLSSDYLADYLNRFYDHHKAIVTYAFHQDKKLLQEIRDQNESAKRKSIENLKRIRLSH